MKGFQEGVSPTSGRQSQNKEGRPVTFPKGLCKLSVGVPVQSRAPQEAEGEGGWRRRLGERTRVWAASLPLALRQGAAQQDP